MPVTGHPSLDLRRAPSPVFTVLVRPMLLGVVLLDPFTVRFDQLLLALGLCEVIVRHPLLETEHSFNKGLPRLALLDLLFRYS